MSGDRGEETALAALLRDAASAPPPASFDEGDVRERYRGQRRRRMRALTGSGLVVVLAAVLVPVLLLTNHSNGRTPDGNLALGPHVSSTPGQKRQELSPYSGQLPGGPSKQGDGSHGRVGPRADGTRGGCARVDRELATALAGGLPVSAASATPVPGGCPAGGRGASLPVRGGTVSAFVLPPGVKLGDVPRTERTREVRHPRSGATVVVLMDSLSGPAPTMRAKLAELADQLAARY